MLPIEAVRALLLTASCLVACAGDGFAALPALDGFQTVLASARDGSELVVAELPQAGLRFDFPRIATDGAHGDLLLYPEKLSDLRLPVANGRLALSEERTADHLPRPSRVLALTEALAWRDDDPAPWTELRMVSPACLELDQTVVDLGPHGEVLRMLPWIDDSVMVLSQIRGQENTLSVVTRDGARTIPAPVPPEIENFAMTADEVGHLWFAYDQLGLIWIAAWAERSGPIIG